MDTTMAKKNSAVDFGFSRLEIEGRIKKLPMDKLCPGAVLKIKNATTSNPQYNEALVAWNARQPCVKAKTGEEEPSNVDKDRQRDRDVFPGSVVVGWEGVRDATTDDLLPYSLKLCKEFCSGLPAFLFDEIRVFAMSPENFFGEQPRIDDLDAGGLAKN